MTWIVFLTRVLIFIGAIFIPGLIVQVGSKKSLCFQFAVSPAYTVVFIGVLSTLYVLINLSVPWYLIYLPIFIFAFTVFLVRFRQFSLNYADIRKIKPDFGVLFLYVSVGIIVTSLIYLKNINGPSSFESLFDNANHLSLIKSFSNSGFYSPVFSNLYSDNSFLNSGFSYYPGGFHCLAALVSSAFDVDAAYASNVVIFCFIAVVFPLSVCCFIRSIFPENDSVCKFGCLVSLSFGVFPWGMIVWGPLYPNLISLCFVPLFVGALIQLISYSIFSGLLVVDCAVLFISIALIHPGGIFTAGVMCVGPLIRYIPKRLKPDLSRSHRLILQTVIGISIVLIWFLCFNLPFFHSTVSYTWKAFISPIQALIGCVSLSFSSLMAQPILALFCFLGFIFSFSKTNRLLSSLNLSLLLAYVIFIVDCSFDGFLKQFLSGFWYTDSHRTAVTVGLILLPYAALGVNAVVFWFISKMRQINSAILAWRIELIASILVLCVLFFPNYYISGYFTVTTQFGQLRESLRWCYGFPQTQGLDASEASVVLDIKHCIDDPSGTIFNVPFDGSPFFYSMGDLNLFYRSLPDNFNSLPQTHPFSVLSMRLKFYKTDPDVARLVKKYNIRYVFLLDSSYDKTSKGSVNGSYSSKKWKGVSINSNTPGFKLLYKYDDIELYKLE